MRPFCAQHCRALHVDCDLIIFGGTGDLAKRSLLPALTNLYERGELGAGSRVFSASRRPLCNDAYRRAMAPATPSRAWSRFAERISHHTVDIADGAGFSSLCHALEGAGGRARLIYLSTLPELFVDAVRRAHDAGLTADSTSVIVEKPVGTDLASAASLNNQLVELFDERQILRIDHYLGKARVRALAHRDFAALTKGGTVQITLAESQDIGTRGEFYDRTGALRDMVQNHLLQLVCLVAMRPDAIDANAAKLEVLSAIRLDHAPVWGQFDGYLDVDGVAPASRTETFVALKLRLDLPGWKGIPILLRTGKCMASKRSQVVAGGHVFDLGTPGENAYEALLLDALKGDCGKFVSREEVEAAWRFIDGLRAKRGDDRPDPYAPGSGGPEAANRLALMTGVPWR